MRIKELWSFIYERWMILQRRSQGLPKPWTKDPILQRYKFCNIFREDDRVTIWIRENWREPNTERLDLWFGMAMARLVNWPETLADLGYPYRWDAARFVKILNGRKQRKQQVFTGAYMIHCGYAGSSKALYIAKEVLTPLWNKRREMDKFLKRSPLRLQDIHDWLIEQQDIGGFMAGQIIADAKYGEVMRSAEDWDTFAVSGPGSRRGMSRLLNIPLETVYKTWEAGKKSVALRGVWKEDEWHVNLIKLRMELLPLFKKAKMPAPHAQDVQSILCEYDKFERTRLGDGLGRPRSLYPGV